MVAALTTLVAGGAGGALVLSGLVEGTAVAVGAGAVALVSAAGAAVWRSRRRGPRAARIDPFAVGEPWRQYVRGALQAQARYARTVAGVAAGPLRERLEEVGRRLDQGVAECWRVAQRGDALDDAVSALDVPRARSRLAAEEAAGDGEVAGSLRAMLAAAERMAEVAAQTRERLRVLEARLDQAVATAVELSLRAATTADAGRLGSDVDHLVDDLEALRAALEETDAIGE